MAKVLKSMKSLSSRRDRYYRTALLFFIAGCGAILSGHELGVALAALVFMAAAAYLQKSKVWGSGAWGEQTVNTVLEKLPGEVYIINDLRIPRGNGTAQIDHVVIAEYGVFCLETKNFSGTITGKDEHCIHYSQTGQSKVHSPARQAVEHAKALRALLAERPEYWEAGEEGLWVQPLLVFSNPNVRVRYSSKDVPVMRLKELPDYFQRVAGKRIIPPEHVVSLALYILGSDIR